jgi:hypothetical protein
MANIVSNQPGPQAQQAVPVVNVPNPNNPQVGGGPQPAQQPQQPGNQPKQQPIQTQTSQNSTGFVVIDAIIMDPRGEIPVKRLANTQDASLPLIETDERGRLIVKGGNEFNAEQYNPRQL